MTLMGGAWSPMRSLWWHRSNVQRRWQPEEGMLHPWGHLPKGKPG